MCLFVNINEHKNLKPKIARQDIFGYKVLLYSSTRKEFYTPYRNVSVDVTAKLKCKCFQNTPQIVTYDPYKCVIEEAVHLYSNLKSALDSAQWHITNARRTHPYLFACVYLVTIPKGKKYWIGMHNDMCTQSISFKDIVDVFCDSFVNIGRDSTFLQHECIALLKDGVNEDILRKFFYSIDVNKIIREYTKAELSTLKPMY